MTKKLSMKQTAPGRSAGWLGWGMVAALAVLFSAVAFRLFSLDPEAVPEELRPNLVHHPILFYMHVLVAPFALLAGVWQFLPVTRRGPYHRWAGRFYVACVVPAAVAGFVVALTTESGSLAGAGFAVLAILWLATTVKAYRSARDGDFVSHRAWMIRSYALTCAAITLRLILPSGIALGAGCASSYVAAAWGSWIANLLIAECILRRIPFRQTEPRRPPP